MAKEIKAEVKVEIKPEAKKQQRLVRVDNVERRKKDGWKVANNHTDKKQIGVSDLVLMEK